MIRRIILGFMLYGRLMADSDLDRFARLALDCVHKDYPNKIAHSLNSDADVKPPRELTPAFYGCYDWHSSVHGHWLLVRLVRMFPQAPFAPEARRGAGRDHRFNGRGEAVPGHDRGSARSDRSVEVPTGVRGCDGFSPPEPLSGAMSRDDNLHGGPVAAQVLPDHDRVAPRIDPE